MAFRSSLIPPLTKCSGSAHACSACKPARLIKLSTDIIHAQIRPLKAFRWHADECPTLNAGLAAAIFQGIRTCIARKPYIFVIFQCGGPDLDPHM